jgi:uncharacterized protein
MRLLLVLAACVGSACASVPTAAADLFPHLQQAEIRIATASGTHRFSVWIAADEQSQQRGLMFVRQLPRDRGMLFIFGTPRDAAFWMKDTYLSLDLIFIDPAGTVLNIESHARPHSLEPIESRGPVIGVLEVLAGTAREIGLVEGDRITLPSLRTTWTPAPGALNAIPGLPASS